jgi:hypothetical protein
MAKPSVNLAWAGWILAGCSGQSAAVNTVCDSKLRPVNAQRTPQHQMGFTLNAASAGGEDRLHILRGFLEVKWGSFGNDERKRCFASIVPESGDILGVRIITAAHCLPDVSDATKRNFKLKVEVLYKGGYIPLDFIAPTFTKSVVLSSLINRHVLPLLAPGQNETWTPLSGTEACKQATVLFKQKSVAGHKTACFSRQDMRLIKGQISENSQKLLRQWKSAVAELGQVKGLVAKELPAAAKSDLVTLRNASSMNSSRLRILRSLAYLSNVQFCSSEGLVSVSSKESTDSRILCDLSQEVRESFFVDTANEVEFNRLLSVRNDSVTPLTQLRETYFRCIESPFSAPDEETSCVLEDSARSSYQKWVIDAETTFSQLPAADKNGLNFADYFRIVTAKFQTPSSAGIRFISFSGKSARSSASVGDSKSVFLFDYDPAVGVFDFEKGDSGSVLNIFGEFPVAVLSTIDGEPTSGGASITPLPEPSEESDPASSTCN